MNFANLLDQYGASTVLATGGALIGVLFGLCAQRSQFCLRAAILETRHRQSGDKTTVWLLAFALSMLWVQAATGLGWFNANDIRQFSGTASVSGAALGGLLFGIGMVLTRACAGRMVVLAAGGNLRALLSGLVFAVTAQATMGGILVPLRNAIGNWWRIDGPHNNLSAALGLPWWPGLVVGTVLALGALGRARTTQTLGWRHAGALGVSLAIALGWVFSYQVASQSFDPVQNQGLTFSLPSAEWLTRITTNPQLTMGFEFGLLPGVVFGAFVAAVFSKTFQLEGFQDARTMLRYVLGAVLMGFGAVLAGGCSIGAAVTGSAVLAATAFIALAGIVLGAIVADQVTR